MKMRVLEDEGSEDYVARVRQHSNRARLYAAKRIQAYMEESAGLTVDERGDGASPEDLKPCWMQRVLAGNDRWEGITARDNFWEWDVDGSLSHHGTDKGWYPAYLLRF